jgi:hypothetical protein
MCIGFTELFARSGNISQEEEVFYNNEKVGGEKHTCFGPSCLLVAIMRGTALAHSTVTFAKKMKRDGKMRQVVE